MLSSHQVAACVRTKDFGRFLPEWIAYHYATGVDEIQVSLSVGNKQIDDIDCVLFYWNLVFSRLNSHDGVIIW